ncbi:phosphoribosylanthranilate isomerase [Myroides sp. M-43]|uniref:phosphoribosylanthranilate isomerase n=1 Tax=Myroides oncorhynchi TaxID=2893756 RepID=UPI001E2DDC32|nr:phosphoribosylanthranilate isomerase [Myroides oncorhynchi]MCC9042343.1 phosphoribosylanthranilate isomerase [Myroides oncorhynchi]
MKKIKICGMFNPDNINAVGLSDIDLMGFIFYPKSKRFVAEDINTTVDNLPSHIKKVGVFVNATREEVIEKVQQYHLDYIQLHGDETVEECRFYTEKGIKVLKAFSIGTTEDLDKTKPYSPYCELFVFDTPTANYGGSGQSFDWRVLHHYHGETPYLLSGGLGIHNIKQALLLTEEKLIGFDINSKLENNQYQKDINLVQQLVNNIRKHERI